MAEETNDTLWATHKRECTCTCGMGDGRLLVALTKELRAVLTELEALPAAKGASKVDELAARRSQRRETAAGS